MIFLILTLAGWMNPASAAPAGGERWIDNKMTELRAVVGPRRLTREQDAMARAVFDAASAYVNTRSERTFALWVSTKPQRGNSTLIKGIARVLWPHKMREVQDIEDYGRESPLVKSFKHVGAILILDDLMFAIVRESQAENIRRKLANLIDEEHFYGAVIVIDAKDLLAKHGADLAEGFQIVDLVSVIKDCQRALTAETVKSRGA